MKPPHSTSALRLVALLVLAVTLLRPVMHGQTPVAHWSFDAGSGTTASDSSTNGHTVTLNGCTWASSGKVGTHALTVTKASSNYATISGPVVDTSASFTVAAWVKLSSTTGANQTFISIDGSTISGFFLQYQNAAQRFVLDRRDSDSVFSNSTVAYATSTATVGTWYHVAGVYDASAHTIALYVNGTLQQQVTYASAGAWSATGNTKLGCGKWAGGGTDYFDGVLDEACFYASALTSTQISGLYSGVTLSGTVFEDANYSGGAGRSLASSGGSGRSGARVEFYDALGNYVGALTTGAGGTFSAPGSANLTYFVRVVNSTVTSSLGGSNLVPVQTYRTTATSGSAVAVTDHVGGEAPEKTDAGNASTTLAALTSGSLTPQSVTTVNAGSGTISGLDFGFAFNTVVNTADSGQGSLRQAIVNANAMSGSQTLAFMIPDGSSHAGLRSGLTNQLTNGVAVITLASLLPAITDTLILDGTSQTSNIGNTNASTLGTGGTVGVDNVSLSTVPAPEVEIVGGSLSVGLDVAAAGSTIRGLAIHGFGDTNLNGDILVRADNVTISQCVIGTTARSFSLPASAPTGGANIAISSGSGGVATNNLIGYSGHNGLRTANDTIGSWTITNNEIRGVARTESARNGLTLRGFNHVASGNLIADCKGPGISLPSTGSSGTTMQNNTVTGCGVGTAGTIQDMGIQVYGTNHTITRNKIYANRGSGVLVTSSASGIHITRNAIYANGTILNDAGSPATGAIGIDLQIASDNVNTGTAPYYTLNDDGDGDTGANGLLNYPVLETATILGSNLVITGWAPANATLEFFVSDGTASHFGQGQTYLGSLVEGSASDTDTTTSSYSGTINGVAQGSDTNAHRFTLILAKPSTVSNGTKLTATTTDASNNTSEFSGQVTVGVQYPSFTVVTATQTYSDPINATTHPKAIPGSFILVSAVATNTATGPSDTDTFTLAAAIPTGTELYVGDLAGSGTGPVTFTNGATSSTLVYSFTSLSNTTDDLEFSNDGGSTWTYSPQADSDGCDAAITHLRLNPKGAFAAASGGNNPSCTFAFRLRVK